MSRLAIITTHPIQYYAPIFVLLAQRIALKVFYTWEQSKEAVYDLGFQRKISWDIPLLEGYEYTFVKNTSKKPGSKKFNGIVNPTLTKDVRSWNPDAILIIGWNLNSHLKALRFFKGKIPVFFRGDSHLLNDKAGMKRILRRLALKWVYRHVDKAFFVGTNNRAYYLASGLKADQLVFTPHAIDNKRFNEQSGENRQKALKWRREIGIEDEASVLLFVGKLEAVKNPLFLLRSFLAVKRENTHLIFVGNGPLEEELKLMATESKNAVHFLPFQNQSAMPVVYCLGDLFVMPSKSETWGLAVNEAMACGLAILASDRVGCAIDLISLRNGGIFKSEDKEDLEEKLNYFFSLNKQDLKKMGEESVRIIETWSFENIVNAICKEVA